jgi:hypothetical protein
MADNTLQTAQSRKSGPSLALEVTLIPAVARRWPSQQPGSQNLRRKQVFQYLLEVYTLPTGY